jgi:hypothetical protein
MNKPSPIISIQNFLKMTPEVPQYSDKNQNYLIAGANPTYYMDNPGIQEDQVAPLVASLNWVKLNVTLDGEIIAMIPASADSNSFSVFIMTNTSRVYGVIHSGGIPTGVTNLGYPDGTAHSGLITGKLACVNNTLYAGFLGGSGLYRVTSFTTPSWSSIFGSVYISGETFLLPFLEYCMITDTSGDVLKIDPSYNQTAGISLGAGWLILGVENLNDKYMVIAAARTDSYDYTENYLFLWDGISGTYNQAMRIPGSYIDMKVIDSILNVAVSISATKTAMYTLSNTSLKFNFSPQYGLISNAILGFVPEDSHSIFNYNNLIGLRLNSTADLIYPLMIYGDTPVGLEEFILTSGNQFNIFSVGTDGLLYAVEVGTGGLANIWYYPQATGTSYQNILYRSQSVPVHNLAGIDIWYETPPSSVTDQIIVTLIGVGEDIITGSTTIVLPAITNTNILNKRRTRIDVQDFAGDKVIVQVTTVNNGTWRPKIDHVDLIQN